jgi:Xaa-Pro aminopeptidase
MKRIEKVQEIISKKRVKALLITNMKNIRYLTGFTGSTAFLLITRDSAQFFTDFRYRDQSLREVTGCEVIVPKGALLKAVSSVAKGLGFSSLGMEMTAPYSLYHTLKKSLPLKPVKDLVESLRLEKEREEFGHLRKAVKRAEDAFLSVKKFIKKGMIERTLALRLEESLKRNGCNHLPFDIIVASGERAALPHARTSTRRFQAGDFVLLDWGGEAEGYFSDMTRTFLLKGHNMEGKIEIYKTVLKANRHALKSVSSGMKAKDLDSVARRIIQDAGFGDYFGHGTGHGVGLDIHEAPHISWMSRETISHGMVFTVEPGIYVPGLGGVRIEDMVYTGKRGVRILTRLPRRLEII